MAKKPAREVVAGPAASGGRPIVSVRSRLMHGGWIPIALIVVAVLLAYLPVLRHATYIWDDARYVTENQLLLAPDGLARIWFDIGATIQYYPMVFSGFWAEYQLWGLQPFGYHLVNVLLHALSAVLLWLVLRRLAVPGAWLAAGIFALHPLQVESVAWVAERKNVLSGVFYLAALLAYLRALPATAVAATAPAATTWRYYFLALVLFALALLSKTVTCSLPAVILLLYWWRCDRLRRVTLLTLLPMFVLGAGMGMVTAWMEKHNVHAVGSEWALSFVERSLIAGRALWFYAGKLLWPGELIFNYSRWEIDPASWWQYLYPLTFILLIALLWVGRQRFGRGPLVAVLIFAGTLFPALGFIDVYPMRYAFVADHFQYLAGIALVTLLVAMLTAAAGRWPALPISTSGSGGIARHRWVIPIVILLVLGTLTWRQGGAYRDRATLWQDTLQKNPTSFLAHCNLGTLLLNQGEAAAALPHLQEAVRLKPDMHEAHASLGKALVDLGQSDTGKAHYHEALRLKPNMAWAYQGLGQVLLDEGRLDEAITCYRQALELMPDAGEAHYNLANALVRQGTLPEAVTHFYRALEFDPDDAATHNNLGNALAQSEQPAQAIPHYREALRLRPGYGVAYRNLGLALTATGDLDGALEAFWLALRADSGDVVAHFHLARVLESRGQYDGALKEYRRTLRFDPDHASARQALQALEARLGADAEH